MIRKLCAMCALVFVVGSLAPQLTSSTPAGVASSISATPIVAATPTTDPELITSYPPSFPTGWTVLENMASPCHVGGTLVSRIFVAFISSGDLQTWGQVSEEQTNCETPNGSLPLTHTLTITCGEVTLIVTQTIDTPTQPAAWSRFILPCYSEVPPIAEQTIAPVPARGKDMLPNGNRVVFEITAS